MLTKGLTPVQASAHVVGDGAHAEGDTQTWPLTRAQGQEVWVRARPAPELGGSEGNKGLGTGRRAPPPAGVSSAPWWRRQ